jgi:hypothetical protein
MIEHWHLMNVRIVCVYIYIYIYIYNWLVNHLRDKVEINTGNGKCEMSNDFRNWVILFTKIEEKKKLKEISPIYLSY